MRFPMTLGPFTKVVTAGTLGLVFVLLPAQVLLVHRSVPVACAQWVVIAVLALVAALLMGAVFVAPRAVRVEGQRLVVERLWWSDFVIPLRQVTGVTAGPPLKILGEARRVLGNGGLMGFTGLFHVRSVGTVRCWATRLNEPTVLVRRGKQRPVLLGVDDQQGLLAALARAPR